MRFPKSLNGRGIILVLCIIFLYACASPVSSKKNDELTNNTDIQKIYSLRVNKLNDKIMCYSTDDKGAVNETVYRMNTQDYDNIKATLIYYTNLWTNSNNGSTLTIIFRDNGERMIFQFSSGDNIEIIPYKFKIYFYNQYDLRKKEVSLDTKFRSMMAGLSMRYKTTGNERITLPGPADVLLANDRQFKPGSDGDLLKRGNEHFAQEQYREAIDQYLKALNLNPIFPAAYFNRGLAYYNLQQYDQSIADFSKHLELSPIKASLRMRGAAYARKGQFEHALADFRRYLEVTPIQDRFRPEVLGIITSLEKKVSPDQNKTVARKDAKENAGQGRLDELKFASPGQLPNCLKYLTIHHAILLKVQKSSAQISAEHGVECLSKGELDQAINFFNKAINLDVKMAEAYLNRGIAYSCKGQYDLAIADYSQALNLKSNLADPAYKNRAVAYYHKGAFAQSWADVRRAESLGLKVHPNFMEDLRRTSGSLPIDSTVTKTAPTPPSAADSKKERVIEGTIKEIYVGQLVSSAATRTSFTLILREYPDLKIELPEAVIRSSNGPKEESWEGKKVKIKCTMGAEQKRCVAAEMIFLGK